MSHEISENDRQQGITQAWHGLTEVLPVIVLASCWLTLWDVKKLVLGVLSSTKEFIAGQFCQLVCTDNESIQIGKPVHCESYTVLTNRDFLAIVQDTLNKLRGAVVASVGSVCNRARIFVTLQIPEMPSFMAAGREFKPYLNFLSSHDKSCPFTLNLSTVCTVCNNTFGMNLADKSNKGLRIVVKHTKGMAAQLADVPAIVDAFFASVQKFTEVMNALALVPITSREARAFFAGLLTDKDDTEDKTETEVAELSTRRANQVDRLTVLFATGKGNNGQNLADVFSAITDYYSHESAGGSDNVSKQIASSEFGTGQTMKAFAFVVLQDDKRIAALIAQGNTVLQAYESAQRAASQ